MAKLDTALKNPNVQAFLNVIAQAEGATYDSLYGDTAHRPRKFNDYSGFPGSGPATASGRYQITKSTYGDLSRKLGLADFSPQTQDRMAAQLLDEHRALEPLLKGDLDAALAGAAIPWRSLPRGPGQPNIRQPVQPYMPYDKVRSLFELNQTP